MKCAKRFVTLSEGCALWFLAVPVVVSGCQPTTRVDVPRSVVTVEWLFERTNDSSVVPIHIGSEDTFDEGHIPGARYLAFGDYVVRNDSVTGLRNQLPSPDVMRDKLEELGVSDDSKIVVYSDNRRTLFATRLLFTLDYLGLREQAFLLDGGLGVWKAMGLPVTSETVEVSRGTLTARPVRDLVVDADWVAERIDASGIVFFDARSNTQYAGEEEDVDYRLGHIPGAASMPLSEIYDQSGKMRHTGELERLFQNAGYTPGDTVVSYCVTGVLATGVSYVARHLGYEFRVYDGSMEEWRADPDRPMIEGR